MKKRNLLLIAGIAVMMTGCTPKAEPVETTAETVVETEAATEETTEEVTEEALEAESEQKTEASQAEEARQEEEASGGLDNFSVDTEEVKNFAVKIQEAVAGKDLEALADLTFFPTYVGFVEGGEFVETKEAFLALGADKIFTQELLDSVSQADLDNLSPSMAGFALTKENGAPNIIFGVQNGQLAISGINY